LTDPKSLVGMKVVESLKRVEKSFRTPAEEGKLCGGA
jgi:hypothetical protein